MIVDSPKTVFRLLASVWVVGIPIAIYIGIISFLDLLYHFEEYNLPVAIVAIPGTVIGLLLAFRTNSCYGRWWEARILWGAIVNDSRTWVRQLMEFLSLAQESAKQDPDIRVMAYRQIAWSYALTRSLRRQNPLADTEQFLETTEIEQLQTHDNVPNAMLLNQATLLCKLHSQGKLETYEFVELEKTLTRLTDSMGGCERIKNTTFPTSYSRLVSFLIYLFIIYLPFGLAAMPPLGLFLTAATLALAFLVIDRAADFLQDPFENLPSDTPMQSLSRIVEINIKQMLGKTDLPEKLTPSDGVLY
ncbi:MAG: bestrophin family protein [Aeoliella sp.]